MISTLIGFKVSAFCLRLLGIKDGCFRVERDGMPGAGW